MFPSVFPGGFLGVPLFFALSGYLMFITSEYSWKEGNFHIRNYYKKRIVKILPALFTSPFTHLWFLAVEIQFYLLWPFVFLLYKKLCRIFGNKKMCFLFLLLALISAGKMLFLYTPGGDPSRVYYGTDTMAFPLLLGIFLGAAGQAWNTFWPSAGKHARLLFPAFLAALCILFVTIDGQFQFLYQGGMFFFSLFFACMIILTEKQDTLFRRLPNFPLFSLLGKKSYGIYLWHYPLIILAFA